MKSLIAPKDVRFEALRCILLAVFLLGVLLHPSPAHAHAALVSSEPTDGSVIPDAPERFALTFSEPVSPLVLGLISPNGTRTELDGFKLQDRVLSIAVPTSNGTGTYMLSWRVVSEDGHPVGGSIVYSVGAPSKPLSPETATANWPVTLFMEVSKVAFYCALFFGIGGVFAIQWLFGEHRPASVQVRMFLWLGFASIPLLLAAQGLDALGLSASALLNTHVWLTGASTSLGIALGIAAIALVLAMVVLKFAQHNGHGPALLALAGVGLALACTGHASSAAPHLLTRPMVALHATAIGFWIGALLPLRAVLRNTSEEAVAPLLKFSRTIPWVLLVLVVAGSILAIVQVQTFQALWQTTYGRMLLVKLLLVAALLGLASFNRWRLTELVEQGSATARRQLARSIGVELVVVLAIFTAVAAWRFTPPPRSLGVGGQPISLHLKSANAMAHVTISSDRIGPVTLDLMLMKPDGSALVAKEVTVSLSLPSARIEPIRREAMEGVPGQWHVDNAVLPVAGLWKFDTAVLISDFESARLSGELNIH